MNAILVVGPAWVGDMVMAQSLLRHLRRVHPQAAIDVMAPAWSKPLLARMPEVRAAIELPFAHGEFKPLQRYRLGRGLRGRYDWAIVLPITWKTALVPFAAAIPRRTGFVGEQRWGLLNDIRRLDKQALPMMVQRYLALGVEAGQPSPEPPPPPRLLSSDEQRQAVRDKFGLDAGRPVLAFCPGAEYGPAKRWPPGYFAELGRHYLARGWQIWVLGSAKDRVAGQAIVQGLESDRALDLTGRTSLEEVIDLLALSDTVVCNDSGLMHIAAALERRVIAVYGSSDPGYTPPLSDKARIVSLGLECSPCFSKECPLGHYRCLWELAPSRVIEAMED